MKPFFKDHTSYGAVIAMLLPAALAMAWRVKQSSLAKVLWVTAAGWLTLGLIFSFTRAAWVSVAAAVVLWGLMLLGIKLRTLILRLPHRGPVGS